MGGGGWIFEGGCCVLSTHDFDDEADDDAAVAYGDDAEDDVDWATAMAMVAIVTVSPLPVDCR